MSTQFCKTYKEFNECMFCYTENVLFEMLARVNENPVEDVDELKGRTLAMMENLSKSELVAWYSEEEQDHPKAQRAHSSRLVSGGRDS
ncbi:hypothetical protein B9Z55_011008 [Caenorhabditis nigoni]|uniref:Uncharacterized protein n=1 Tax=Caenorhabditis nigoni TaxID=1611254 RepID=A0A2G5UJ74_9PELO|nr:hypothetical protein B9Z55_011008 [Caenorhabditis nigoni]